jgi:PAS domain S-box-containing protein
MNDSKHKFSGRVLIVDDDPMIRLLACEALEQSGFEVMEADNGVDAISALNKFIPDIILLDLLMPGMDGFQTCQEIRSKPIGADVPILILTGLDDLESITTAYELGATDFVTKPIQWLVLPHRVQFIMNSSFANSERRRAEIELRKSEERFRSLMTLSPDIISIIDANGNLTYNSPAALAIHGYDQEEMINRNIFDLMHPEDQERIGTEFAKLLGGPNQQAIVQYRYRSKDGSYSWMECRAVNHLDNPFINGIIAISRDFSARKAEEQKQLEFERNLQQSQKLESLGVLSGGIAHDFNNILAIIMGYCALTKMDYEKTEKNIPEIEKAVERAAALCRQMLAYAGKASLTHTQIIMSTLVDEMVSMLKTTIKQNVLIKSELGAGIPAISGDASQIRQIVMNLIINAAEAIGDDQGEIGVSLAKAEIKAEQTEKDHIGKTIPAGQYICLEVTDNGCGMEEETRRKIFEPFYTTKFTGRGLGMSAVLGIITAHKGALQLESQPGQGTTFKVYLPVHIGNSETEETHRKAASAPWQGSGTILLAEDEVQVKYIAITLLKKLGFKVIDAANGKEALELYQKNAADITLVVTDIGMPVMNGYELFYKLKQLSPQLPIVISSGFGEGDIALKIPPEKTAGFINKPYNFDKLRDVLRAALG